MQKSNSVVLRWVYKVGALLLVLAFFVLPVVSCAVPGVDADATGLQLATGGGDLMELTESTYPLMFIMVAIPVIMAALAFLGRPFGMLRNIAVLGILGQLAFVVWTVTTEYFREDAIEFAFGAWAILGLYVILTAVAQMGAGAEKGGSTKIES